MLSLAIEDGHEWPEESRNALLDRLAYFIPHHVQMYFGHVMDHCRMKGITAPSVGDVNTVYETHMLSTRGHAELADYEERLLRVLDKSMVELALALLTEAAVVGILTPRTAKIAADRTELEQAEKGLRDVLRVLEHDGYLELDAEAGHWSFVAPLIRDWWRRRFGTGYQPLDSEGQG